MTRTVSHSPKPVSRSARCPRLAPGRSGPGGGGITAPPFAWLPATSWGGPAPLALGVDAGEGLRPCAIILLSSPRVYHVTAAELGIRRAEAGSKTHGEPIRPRDSTTILDSSQRRGVASPAESPRAGGLAATIPLGVWLKGDCRPGGPSTSGPADPARFGNAYALPPWPGPCLEASEARSRGLRRLDGVREEARLGARTTLECWTRNRISSKPAALRNRISFPGSTAPASYRVLASMDCYRASISEPRRSGLRSRRLYTLWKDAPLGVFRTGDGRSTGYCGRFGDLAAVPGPTVPNRAAKSGGFLRIFARGERLVYAVS